MPYGILVVELPLVAVLFISFNNNAVTINSSEKHFVHYFAKSVPILGRQNHIPVPLSKLVAPLVAPPPPVPTSLGKQTRKPILVPIKLDAISNPVDN